MTVHDKPIHGFCENGCKVQVYSRSESDEAINGLKTLNVKLNHTIPTTAYQDMTEPTSKKKFYVDVPCTKSKVTMNCQISPADEVEDVSLSKKISNGYLIVTAVRFMTFTQEFKRYWQNIWMNFRDTRGRTFLTSRQTD